MKIIIPDSYHYDVMAEAFADAKLVGVGIDWNRVTVDADLLGYQRGGVGVARGVRDLAGISERGNRAKPFGNSGFKGLAIGSATLGYRDTLAWVELRSSGSERLFEREWYDMARCTRIDLRVDVAVPATYQMLGESILKGYKYLASTYKRNGGWKIPSYVCKGEGETVYIGSRESSHFCRVYNKTIEGGVTHPHGYVWRIEWQFGQELANEVAHGLRRNGYGERDVFDHVMAYNKTNGLPTSFGWSAKHMEPIRVPRVGTDNQRSHAWLARTVAPTVRRLTSEGEFAKLEKSLGLLGLDTRTSGELF